MNKEIELTSRECHQKADDALKAVKVSIIHHGLLQHGQAFMIKAMTRLPKHLPSMWFQHTVGWKMYWA